MHMYTYVKYKKRDEIPYVQIFDICNFYIIKSYIYMLSFMESTKQEPTESKQLMTNTDTSALLEKFKENSTT